MVCVYVAGPYRAGIPGADPRVQDAWQIQRNVMAAMGLALEVWKLGAVAICPHANTMFYQNAAGCADNVWLDGDLEILKRCDVILMTPDWERSSGARAERDFALKLDIPVLYDIPALKEYLDYYGSNVA